MTTWYVIYSLGEADVATWELRARTHGVQVRHLSARECHDFDSAARPGSRPGVYRSIGRIRFNKVTRRWTALVNSDCNAAEATLCIAATVGCATRLAGTPGAFLRRKIFEHTSDHSGHPIAETGVCYRLSEDDLRRRAVALAESPDDIEELTHLVDELYEERLNGAQA